ncbi:DUF1062 domain-containing protein [Streptacidiphilus fuscans]|uniref:DUF1062 domain-containing protein n=1 Tax=Streptacidiphilus fuscans TaxID=2789292 RepID=A0A931B5P8_9ACTN|nr:DUF1062 domain-containing protein [Streptacidiphilus fuscans]MBF9071695.1 DUF1062 domain-containing protein [Streptacidiphilus fuscans]
MPSAHESTVGPDRKSLWAVHELGLPAIVRPCVDCRSTRHRPTGKIRVNASGKLLDIWMLIGCEQCDRTSKVPVHERVHVQSLDPARLVKFEDNDAGVVRELTMCASLAARTGYRLDWTGTWRLATDTPFEEPLAQATAHEVHVRFELPAPVRVEKLLMLGLGASRSRIRKLVEAQRILLPLNVDAKAHRDFRFVVGAGEG